LPKDLGWREEKTACITSLIKFLEGWNTLKGRELEEQSISERPEKEVRTGLSLYASLDEVFKEKCRGERQSSRHRRG